MHSRPLGLFDNYIWKIHKFAKLVRGVQMHTCIHHNSLVLYKRPDLQNDTIDESLEPNLCCLTITHCAVPRIPPRIWTLGHLHKLDLSYNLLHAVPRTIGQLYSLRTLYLDHNDLHDLPTSLKNLKHLEAFNLTANPHLPRHLVGTRNGRDAVKEMVCNVVRYFERHDACESLCVRILSSRWGGDKFLKSRLVKAVWATRNDDDWALLSTSLIRKLEG